MKVLLGILKWLGIGGAFGGTGYLIGSAVEKKKAQKIVDEQCWDCAIKCDKCEYKELLETVTGLGKDEITDDLVEELMDFMKAHDLRKEYAGEDIPEEEVPEMVTETPEMPPEPDTDETEPSTMIDIITEEDYYAVSVDREELLFYTEDEVIFDKTTQSKLTDEEIQKLLYCANAHQAGLIFFGEQKDGSVPDTHYIRNNILGAVFRMDRMDAAYDDGDTSGGEYEEEEDG